MIKIDTEKPVGVQYKLVAQKIEQDIDSILNQIPNKNIKNMISNLKKELKIHSSRPTPTSNAKLGLLITLEELAKSYRDITFLPHKDKYQQYNLKMLTNSLKMLAIIVRHTVSETKESSETKQIVQNIRKQYFANNKFYPNDAPMIKMLEQDITENKEMRNILKSQIPMLDRIVSAIEDIMWQFVNTFRTNGNNYNVDVGHIANLISKEASILAEKKVILGTIINTLFSNRISHMTLDELEKFGHGFGTLLLDINDIAYRAIENLEIFTGKNSPSKEQISKAMVEDIITNIAIGHIFISREYRQAVSAVKNHDIDIGPSTLMVLAVMRERQNRSSQKHIDITERDAIDAMFGTTDILYSIANKLFGIKRDIMSKVDDSNSIKVDTHKVREVMVVQHIKNASNILANKIKHDNKMYRPNMQRLL